MATSFNTQVGGGKYRLQFETNNKEHYKLMQKAAHMCVDDKLPTIEPRWIPASEPPKVWEDEETKVMIDYLVYSPEYGVFMAHWCAPMERWLIDGESVRVTHWQQLPEGPKED